MPASQAGMGERWLRLGNNEVYGYLGRFPLLWPQAPRINCGFWPSCVVNLLKKYVAYGIINRVIWPEKTRPLSMAFI